MIGGFGADTFLFTVAPGAADADRIIDFVSGTDKLVIDGLVHADTGPSGTLTESDGRFWAAPGATSGHDADDRIVCNTSTGDLWYDADGSGSGSAELIATLHGARPLAASDISIVTGRSPDLHLVGTEGNDTLEGDGIDDLYGGAGDDVLVGGSLAEASGGELYGDEGDDVLIGDQAGLGFGLQLNGGDGNDSLYGANYDFMYGGRGADAFFFNVLPPEWSPAGPAIGDFASGIDKIVLDSAAFADIGAVGDFAENDPRFLALDGGDLAARLVVGLSGWTPFAATDITVI